jgi:YHS domain-containing protein
MRFHLQVRNEFEYVCAKPPGDGFTGVAVKDFRFAVLRPFADGRNELSSPSAEFGLSKRAISPRPVDLRRGIDLALRVVERYYGREVANRTTYYMEYQGQGWMNESSNSIYAKVGTDVDNSPYCLVCGMDVDPQTAPSSSYKGKTYYFCMPGHKHQFDATPEKFLKTILGNEAGRSELPASLPREEVVGSEP